MRFRNSTTATLMLIFDVYYLVVSRLSYGAKHERTSSDRKLNKD